MTQVLPNTDDGLMHTGRIPASVPLGQLTTLRIDDTHYMCTLVGKDDDTWRWRVDGWFEDGRWHTCS